MDLISMLLQRREKLSSILHPKEILLFHTRDVMSKGDDEYFHSCDSWFQYYFLNAHSEKMVGIIIKDKNSFISSKIGITQKSEIQQTFQGSISKEEIIKLSNVDEVCSIEEITQYIKSSIEEGYTLSYVLDEKVNYYSTFKQYISTLQQYTTQTFENKISQLIQFREIKDEFEIQAIKYANDIAKEVFEELLKSITELKTEQEVFAKLSYEIFKRDSQHSFYPIVAGGRNALTLHYNKHNSILNENELLLLDFGCEYLGYKSDISRTIPISQTFTNQQKELYQAVLRVQEFAISQVKEGVYFKEFEQQVAQKMGEELVMLELISKEEFQENPQVVRKYFPHRCSHHLGLDTHDIGTYEEMRESMVITIEPGLYIKELGVAIRVEDNVVVTKLGCENLSKNIPKKLEDIEKIITN
ncbi:MAG: M24 family metallopeptidase [Nanoarchaeota archaeon]|nr:M24 family metallopeptidase [Nanoarchaeota archaeon]